MALKLNKIRLHKRISLEVKAQDLEFTLPEIQKNIQSFGVNLDGELIKNRLTWVRDFQEISIDHWPKRVAGDYDKLKIILETEDFLILYKASNIVVESGAGHQKDNLLSWLRENGHKLSDLKAKELSRISLVHRLDKDTQGLLLLAKSETSKNFLQDQFRLRKVVKKYLAVVDNLVDKMWITTHYQVRDKQRPLRQKLFWTEAEALSYDPLFRSAKTIIRPLFICRDLNRSLVEVEIKTGRMHQIRLVCESLDFPLFRDKVYFGDDLTPPPKIQEFAILPLKAPISKNPKDFLELQNNYFGQDGYGLLANYLKFKAPDNQMVEVTYVDILNKFKDL